MSQLTMRRHDLAGLPEVSDLPDGYELREARRRDRAGLAVLMAKAFGDDSWDEGRVDRELLEDVTVPLTLIVAYGEDEVVATASLQMTGDAPSTGVLHWVAADPAHRGKKLGYVVSLAVLHECVRMGHADACLLTDDERLPAIHTYLSLGFEPAMLDDTHPSRWQTVLEALRRA